MLGVRFGAVCTIVLGGMLASSAADAAQACDQRLPRTCKSAAAQSNRESPKATSVQRSTATNRSRRAARQRHGTRHAQSARSARRTAEAAPTRATARAPTRAPAPSIVPYVQEGSPAARRFSQFVSPRLLAANPVEELHKPRMNVSELSGQTAYPVIDGVEREPSGPAIEPAHAASHSAVEEVDPGQSAQIGNQPTPAVGRAETIAQLSASPVGRSGDRDPSDGSTSWVRIVFLTWGGLLTLGSALRLLIG
jgi:hypothetical protein